MLCSPRSERCTPLRAAAARANAALSAVSAQTGNFPPRDMSSYQPHLAGQQFYWSPLAADVGLQENSALLHTVVAVSGVLPHGRAGRGLYAQRAFAEGHILGYMWGRFVTEEEWEAIKLGKELHEQHTQQHGVGEDFVAPVQAGVHRCVSIPVQHSGVSLLLASEQCPMAYINQGSSAAQRNVRLAVPSTSFSEADEPAYQYVPCVVATHDHRGIAAGEEILTDYGWKPQDMQRLTAIYNRYLQRQRGKEGAVPAAAAGARSWSSADLQTPTESTASTSWSADSSSVITTQDLGSEASSSTRSSRAAAARVSVRARPAAKPQTFTAAQCSLSEAAPHGWLRTVAAAHSRAKLLAGQLASIYQRISSLAFFQMWFYLRGGATQIDLLSPQLGMCEADRAVVLECSELMRQTVHELAPHHPVELKLAQLKLLFCKHGVGRQPLHFDLGKAEHLCFSALMAGCDTVGTHLPLASLAQQHELYRGSVAERHKHPLCSDQLRSVPAHFTSDLVSTGDIAAFRCDTLHAGPLNNTGRDRIMLYALFTQLSYDERKGQGDHQHYPCGELDGDITVRKLTGAKRKCTAPGPLTASTIDADSEVAVTSSRASSAPFYVFPPQQLFAGEQYQRLCEAWCSMSGFTEEHFRTAGLRSGGSQSAVPPAHPLRADTETCMRWGLQHAVGQEAAAALHLIDIAHLRSGVGDGPMPVHTDFPMDTPAQRAHAACCYAVLLYPHDCQSSILPRLTDAELGEVFSSGPHRQQHFDATNFFTFPAAAGTLLVFRGDTLHAAPKNRSQRSRVVIYAMFSPTRGHTQFDRAWYPNGMHTLDLLPDT